MSDSKSTKSSKFAAAVGRATGEEMTVTKDDPAATPQLIPSQEFGGIVQSYTPADVMADMSGGEMEFAPRVLELKEGMLIVGVLEGRGGNVELEEVDRVAKTVKIKQVPTWIVRDIKSGQRASFLTAAQLEDKLPPFIGGVVKIYVGGMVESKKGRHYRDFLVGGPKLEGGASRSFARVIDVPALPAGADPASSEDLTDHGIVS
jgi:hypothetical protein